MYVCIELLIVFTATTYVQEFRIFVKTSKPRQTRARLGNVELADEAELANLAVG